jgi:DNA-binding transcriptional MerR regulator/uncharacterized protein (DUF433 family)
MSAGRERKSCLGVGLYSIAEAKALLGVNQNKIRRWIDTETGILARYFDPTENTLTFLELMELHFVKLFRDEGVSLQTIRKAAIAAAAKFAVDYPFAVKRFDTDGRTVFATLVQEEQDRVMVEDLKHGQYVFDQIVRPFFRKIEYRGVHEAMRYWPLGTSGGVVLDPERKFGKPIHAETGIPTAVLFQAYLTEQDTVRVSKWFDVPLDAVNRAVEFEQSLAT